MAIFTNSQFLDGGTARTAGEVRTFNGGSLTVRTDTRWHANARMLMAGNSVISPTLGGELFLDGTLAGVTESVL
jgi:glutamate synthase domain-containing protein 3